MNGDNETPVQVGNRVFVMYYSVLLVLLGNSVVYYYEYESASVSLIVGLILVISLIMLSLGLILAHQLCVLSVVASRYFYSTLYFITGIAVVFCDPNLVMLLFSRPIQTTLPNYYVLFTVICLGANKLVPNRKVFYSLSYFFTSLYFSLGIYSGNFVTNSIVLYFFFVVFVFYKGNHIKKQKRKYNVIMTEGEEPEENRGRNQEAKTPLDEIVFEIQQGINTFDQISKRSSPKIQKIYKKFKKLLAKLLQKLQSTNIYSSRLELITKNMDVESKRYIEQVFFDSYASSISYKPENISPKKIIEYDLNELASVLRKIEKEWNFDTFFLADCSNAPIRVIGEFIFKRYGLDEFYSIPERVLKNFLVTLEKNYLDNPYHGSTHGADVLCSFLYLINASTLKKAMSSLEWLGAVVANLAHDVGHPAKNNRFLIMTKHEYAIVYNDISVLEMMHSSLLFKILQVSDNNIFEALAFEAEGQVRKLIIDMVLATDMSKHFDLVSYSRAKYSQNIDFTSADVRTDLFRLLIKCADVAHAAKSLELHLKWCNLVIEEFYAQGDLEKELGLSVSMFCDRENTNIGKMQSGFIKNIVLTLYETIQIIALSSEFEKNCIQQLKSNLKYWENFSVKIGSSTEKDENNTHILMPKKSTMKSL